MPEPQEQAVDVAGLRQGTDSAQIARSLGSIWERFSGQSPKSTSVEIGRDVVRCVIEEGTPSRATDPDGETSTDPDLSPIGLEYNATAVVARVTGRRVVAFIPKRDKTDVSTQTFILDRPPQRF
jgi:hypothetical protein